MKLRFITSFGFALTLMSAFIITPEAVTAAPAVNPAGAGQALEIAPPVLNLSADPGQSIEAKIGLRDVSTSRLIVTGEINDFVAAGEDGTPKLLLDQTEESPYSLKKWIAPLPSLTLKPKQLESLPVTIHVPANASPGGYYAVVRFTATAPDIDSTGVSLSASLGALILLKVNGEARESMEIAEFSVTKNGQISSLFQSTPLTFVERLKNTGNIHEQPRGQIEINDMFGNKIAAVNVNLPQNNVLPGSTRKFTQPLDSSVLGNKFLFGRYKADLKVKYGSDGQTVTSSKVFWVIPYTLISAVVIGLIVLFFVLRMALRRYNERIISRSRRRW